MKNDLDLFIAKAILDEISKISMAGMLSRAIESCTIIHRNINDAIETVDMIYM